MSITSYRQLEVWQRAIQLVEAVYLLARQFPTQERYGLTDQLQRAAVSVPANIAEGWGRSHQGEYLHHLSIARGSLMEVETLLIIAEKLKYAGKGEMQQPWNLSQEVGKMLTAMLASMTACNSSRQSNAKRYTLNAIRYTLNQVQP